MYTCKCKIWCEPMGIPVLIKVIKKKKDASVSVPRLFLEIYFLPLVIKIGLPKVINRM